MDDFVKLPAEERRIYFEGTAAARNMQGMIVEKDFWVCWTLKQLFGLSKIGGHLIFKGGTSLSKVFKIIERFSEDIDVSINREFLGFGGANEPEAGTSNKVKQRRIDELKSACQRMIADELMPALKTAIQSKVKASDVWAVRLDDDDPDKQTLLFDYPTSFPADADSYIRRTVKIEMGARSDHWPFEVKEVTPYAAEDFPKGFKEPACVVKVLAVERTFWEKATILHAEFHRPMDKTIPERFSRHYSDFYELIRKGISKQASQRLDLLKRVSEHKSLFFKSSWAKYGEATKGMLRIVPPDYRLSPLRQDYAKMQQMFFAKPPEFDAIIALLKEWESEFNHS